MNTILKVDEREELLMIMGNVLIIGKQYSGIFRLLTTIGRLLSSLQLIKIKVKIVTQL